MSNSVNTQKKNGFLAGTANYVDERVGGPQVDGHVAADEGGRASKGRSHALPFCRGTPECTRLSRGVDPLSPGHLGGPQVRFEASSSGGITGKVIGRGDDRPKVSPVVVSKAHEVARLDAGRKHRVH